MAEKYVTETDLKKFLQCARCKRTPTGPPIHICRTGHLECSVCYAKHTEEPRVDETDASTDSESDSASYKKEDANNIGVIFPKESKYDNNAHHTCPVCKEEVLKTRSLLAENLLHHLETVRTAYIPSGGSRHAPPPSPSHQPQIAQPPLQQLQPPSSAHHVVAPQPQGNCVECCYNIYGPPCHRFDSSSVTMTAYESQTYTRYRLPCGLQQYNYHVDPYTNVVDYADPNVFYPDYDNVSYYNGCAGKRDVVDKRSRYNFVPQSSVASLAGEPSKRPIRCPTHLCGRNIAVTALCSHFCFDHPDVPPVSVDFDVSSHLFVVPDMIPFNYGRCVAMLLIPNRFDPVNSVSHSNLVNSPKVKNSLPLVVMASRLDCITNPPSGEEETTRTDSLSHGDFRPRERCRPDSAQSGKGSNQPALTSAKSPLLVIWLAGIDANTSLFTTLQVTEKQTNIRSVVYTGPVTSLRSNQNTTKVFEQGDCLVIHSGILENIIGDRGGFDLHVVVH